MSYGPTTNPTPSVLAFDGQGKPRLYWDNGLRKTTAALPRIAKLLVDVETPEGETASAMFPSGRARRLVTDPGRELVLEHWAQLVGQVLGATSGAHLITEQRSDGLVRCELIVSQGVCDPKVANSWRGCLRFKKFRVRVLTPGWESTTIALGAPVDGYFGAGQAFAISFVLFQPSVAGAKLAAERLAQLADLELPDPFPGIGPGEHVLPRSLNSRQDPLNAGPRVGPLHFDSAETKGWAEGGDQLYPVPGYECSPAAARSYVANVTRVLSRQGCARVHPLDGHTIQHHEWPNPGKFGSYRPYDNRWAVDPWNWAGLAGSLVAMFGWNRGSQPQGTPQFRELNPGPSSTRQLVTDYKGHDVAHNGRVRAIAVPAWYFARSWAARKLIEWNAHDLMHGYTLAEIVVRLAAAQNSPAGGLGEYLREIAWLQGGVADLLSVLGENDDDRPYVNAWVDMLVRLQSREMPSNGFLRQGRPPNSDNGVPYAEGLPREYAACAWFQLGIWAPCFFDAYTASGGPRPDVDAQRFEWLMSAGLLQGLDNPALPLRNGSPPNYLGVALQQAPGSQVFVTCDPISVATVSNSYGSPGSGYGHAIHDWTHLALWRRAAVAAGNANAVARAGQLALKIGPRFPSLPAAIASWRSKPDPWNVLAAAYL